MVKLSPTHKQMTPCPLSLFAEICHSAHETQNIRPLDDACASDCSVNSDTGGVIRDRLSPPLKSSAPPTAVNFLHENDENGPPVSKSGKMELSNLLNPAPQIQSSPIYLDKQTTVTSDLPPTPQYDLSRSIEHYEKQITPEILKNSLATSSSSISNASLQLKQRAVLFETTINAVAAICRTKLYKSKAPTMESYFKSVWGISKSQVYRFLNCAKVLKILSKFPRRPTTEALCRALHKSASTTVELQTLWTKILEFYGSNYDHQIPTSAAIRIWDQLQMKSQQNLPCYKVNHCQSLLTPALSDVSSPESLYCEPVTPVDKIHPLLPSHHFLIPAVKRNDYDSHQLTFIATNEQAQALTKTTSRPLKLASSYFANSHRSSLQRPPTPVLNEANEIVFSSDALTDLKKPYSLPYFEKMKHMGPFIRTVELQIEFSTGPPFFNPRSPNSYHSTRGFNK